MDDAEPQEPMDDVDDVDDVDARQMQEAMWDFLQVSPTSVADGSVTSWQSVSLSAATDSWYWSDAGDSADSVANASVDSVATIFGPTSASVDSVAMPVDSGPRSSGNPPAATVCGHMPLLLDPPGLLLDPPGLTLADDNASGSSGLVDGGGHISSAYSSGLADGHVDATVCGPICPAGLILGLGDDPNLADDSMAAALTSPTTPPQAPDGVDRSPRTPDELLPTWKELVMQLQRLGQEELTSKLSQLGLDTSGRRLDKIARCFNAARKNNISSSSSAAAVKPPEPPRPEPPRPERPSRTKTTYDERKRAEALEDKRKRAEALEEAINEAVSVQEAGCFYIPKSYNAVYCLYCKKSNKRTPACRVAWVSDPLDQALQEITAHYGSSKHVESSNRAQSNLQSESPSAYEDWYSDRTEKEKKIDKWDPTYDGWGCGKTGKRDS